MPCLALAWLALAVLGLLKPSASLVCRLCHETLAPDDAEQNSWHWSWPEGAEHGPQPEYFISALCYSLCAHITQTRLNFCNFSLHSHKHSHKYILMLILFQKISQPKLVRSHSRLPFGFNHQPQRQQKRLHIFIINAPRLALQAPQHPQAKPSRASQADTGPDRSSQLNCLSSLSLSLPLPTLSLSLSLLLPGFVR